MALIAMSKTPRRPLVASAALLAAVSLAVAPSAAYAQRGGGGGHGGGGWGGRLQRRLRRLWRRLWRRLRGALCGGRLRRRLRLCPRRSGGPILRPLFGRVVRSAQPAARDPRLAPAFGQLAPALLTIPLLTSPC